VRDGTTVTLARRVDRWMFAPEPAARLHGAITVLALTIGVRVALGPYSGLANQPAALFDPPWFLGWLDRMPARENIIALQLVGAAGATLAVLGRYRRATFAVAWAALVVLAGLRASRGKIQHNDLLLISAAVPFLAAAVDTTWRDHRAGSRYGWPIRCGMVVAAIAYCTSGVAKLIGSGTRWVFSDNMSNILYDGARAPKTHAGDLARWIGDHGRLAQLIALTTIVFELAFPLALAYVRLRPIAVGGAIVLHGSIFLLLGLDYWAWAATVVALFVNWPSLGSAAPVTGVARDGAGAAL
jgi:hypothetical protein